jgi:hypothetical protein
MSVVNDKMIQALEDYMVWKREKELYPPKWTPEEYAEHILNMEARATLIRIHNIFDSEDPGFLASNSNALTDMILEAIDGNE